MEGSEVRCGKTEEKREEYMEGVRRRTGKKEEKREEKVEGVTGMRDEGREEER